MAAGDRGRAVKDTESGWGCLGAMVPAVLTAVAVAVFGLATVLNALALAGFVVLVVTFCWAVCREPACRYDEAKHAVMAQRWERG